MADVSVISVLLRAKDETAAAFSKVEANAGKMASGIAKHRRSIGLGMTAMGGAIVGLGVLSVKAASDVEEMQGKFNVVFGSMAGEVEKWAATHGDAVGRSRFRLMEYASTLQDTFVPMGFARDEASKFARAVTELAVDIGSFNTQPTEEVVRSLQSALVGNTETVRKYGIVITAASVEQRILNEGWANSKNEITEAMKVQARMTMIMEGSTDAIGDAERTSGSFANQMVRLKDAIFDMQVSVGQFLIPILAKLIEKITPILVSIMKWVQEHPKLTKIIVIATGVFGALMLVLGPLLLILPSLVTAIGRVSGAFVTLNLAMGPIGLTLTGITMAIIAGIAIWKNWDAIIEFVRRAIGNFASDVIGFIITLGDGLAAITKWIPGMDGVADAISGTMDTLRSAQETVDRWAENSDKRIEEMGNAWGELGDSHHSTAGAMKTNNETISDSTTQLANTVSTKTEEMVHGWGAVEDAMKEATVARIEQINEVKTQEERHAYLVKLGADSRKSLFEKELEEFMERKRRQGDVYDGMLDDASVYYDMVAQKAEASAKRVATASDPHIGQGMRATAMAPYPGGPVLPVGSSFDHSGWNKFSAEQQEKARMNWSGMSDKQLQQMFSSSQEAVRWAASQEQFKRGTARSSFSPGNVLTSESADWAKFELAKLAQGGIVRLPTMALVGESGPEAVIPLGRGGGMGSVNNFHFHGAVYGVEDLKEAVVEAVRDHAISGGFSGVFAEA